MFKMCLFYAWECDVLCICMLILVNMLSNILLFLSSWSFCIRICLFLHSVKELLYIFKDNVRPTYRDDDYVFLIYCSLHLNMISLFLLRCFSVLNSLLSKGIKMGTLESIVHVFMVHCFYIFMFYLPALFCFIFIVFGHYNFESFKNSTWESWAFDQRT